MRLTTLHLAKQNFKFSSGHFLIFNDQNAEKLHGHNYRVQVDIQAADEAVNDGYFVDFSALKAIIKAQLDLWDEHVLLPAKQKDMKISSREKNYEVHFRDRFYSFPQNEVVLLPVTNTSVENLSKLLAEALFKAFQKFNVKKMRVRVEETPGQSASYLIAT
jgi:6-pyruvoyltetrahydropterin/6-carboxytetrahydropterin synthase